MELNVLIDSASTDNADRHAFALIIYNALAPNEPPLLETSAQLDPPDPSRESLPHTTHTAAYHALLKALRFIASHNQPIDQVTFQTGSQRLANQITGIEPVTAEAEQTPYQQAMMALLSIDSWTITADRESARPATELANKALAADPTHTPANQSIRFTAELAEDPKTRCPARSPHATPFAFGPDTPGGLCIYAAAAALNAVLQNMPADSSDQNTQTTACPRCNVGIKIKR